jgi:hypothetical protein
MNYEDAITYLRDVAAGKAVLLDGTGEAIGTEKKTPEFN